jgi:hypothetical protein
MIIQMKVPTSEKIFNTVESTDGKRRLLVYRRDDGLFGFREEEQVPDRRGNVCWTPNATIFAGIFETEISALQEARSQLPWFKAMRH